MQENAIAYFQRSSIRYSKGDVQELLEKELNCAGPLLAVIVNGIDSLGGMRYGFHKGSRKRSVEFMKSYMNLSEPVAEFIYMIVRNGIVHQGMPKVGFDYGVLYDRPEKRQIYYKAGDSICLSVVEFAYAYLEAVDHIAMNPEKHIRHYPRLDDKSKKSFEDALKHIEDYTGGCCYRSSLSAYGPDYNLDVSIELPPEEEQDSG